MTPAVEARLYSLALASALDCDDDDPSAVVAAIMRCDDPRRAVALAWRLLIEADDEELQGAIAGSEQ